MTEQDQNKIKKLNSTNLVNLLIGNRNDYSLEHRFFNSVCFFSALAAIFATVTNVALGLNIILTTITFFAGLIMLLFYYISRILKKYKPLLPFFIVLALGGLSNVWFFNSASEGPVVFIYLIAMVFFVIITEGKTRTFVIIAFIVDILLLLYLESNYPQWVTHYENETVRFYDIAITFIFSFVLIYFVVAVLVRSYRDERTIATRQNNEITFQKKQITDSIIYASTIQEALLPDNNFIKKIIPDSFVVYKPKDIVSGDFYWWANVENHTIITAVDCTGHGVPGAFMSMLGISFLREIVMKEYITHPGVILRKLRKEIVKSLNQKDELGAPRDGMDMALISINHDNQKVQYAGAHNPLYIIGKNLQKPDDKSFQLYSLEGIEEKLLEIKPDKMPIAIYHRMDPFTNYEIQLKKGDQIYMFSDGFVDQFGGEDKKRFMNNTFRELLLKIANNPMVDQKEIIENTFDFWKGDTEQIDDVVIVGIKI